MRKMTKVWRLAVAVTAVAALATSGCQARDRAGGNADVPVTQLKFAVTGDPATQITAWADEVSQLSRGTMKITFIRDAHAEQPDYEAATIADVRTGTVDLAWVGARAFDQVGVTSFQPLLAPLLIDSLELERKVFDARIPQQMLPNVEQLDLVGIGVLPGPIRKVLGVSQAFTSAADFKDRTVGIQASGVADQTFRTLGGTVTPMTTGAKQLDGLDAYEQQLASIQGNHYVDQAKYVTGNLNLWPRPLVIIANRTVYDRLTQDQHDIMAAAAKDSVGVAMEAEETAESDAIASLCKAGLTFAHSSDADQAALNKKLAPIYATIRKDAASAGWLDQIMTIKQALHRAPDTADCANVADDNSEASRYDGTYRQTVDFSRIKPCPDDGVPPTGIQVGKIILRNGSIQMWNWSEGNEELREIGWNGTYSFFKDQMLIADSSARLTVDFRYDGRTLTLSHMRGSCGDARAWTAKPWIRQ